MVSKLFAAFGEVLAPTLHTPLEDFRSHWKAIKKFYIDKEGMISLNSLTLYFFRSSSLC